MSNATVPQTTAPAPRMIGRTMIVTSSSNPKQSYTVTDRGCSCKGYTFRKSCKHVEQRAALLAARKPQTDAEYAKTLAACDELF